MGLHRQGESIGDIKDHQSLSWSTKIFFCTYILSLSLKLSVLTRFSSNATLLVPLPPQTPPVWDKIDKLLAPSRQALELFANDITSGAFVKFADRVWEKSFTKEPFVLAQRSLEKLSEAWKSENDDDDNNKKRR